MSRHCLDQFLLCLVIKLIIFLCFEALCEDNLKEKEILNGSPISFLIPFSYVQTVTCIDKCKMQKYTIETL